jgi:hypothetical protein
LNTEKFLAPKKVAPAEDVAETPSAELDSDESSDPTPTLPGIEPRR